MIQTDFESELLAVIAAEVETAGEPGREASSDLRYGGVAWRYAARLDRPLLPVERKAFRRAAEKLEAAGMIERVAAGTGRLTHVRPSRKLVEAIPRITAGQANMKAVADALSQTSWGAGLAAVARELADQAPEKTEPAA